MFTHASHLKAEASSFSYSQLGEGSGHILFYVSWQA